MRREKWLAKKINNVQKICSAHIILQQISHCSFQKHEFFLQFLLSANKNFCYKVSIMAQVFKNIFIFQGQN